MVPQPGQHLHRQLHVVDPEIRAAIQDRHSALRRLGVGDRLADRRREQLVAVGSPSDTNASRECVVRMSAMFSTTPIHFRSGFSAWANSMTWLACSTPCSAKYCASADSSAQSAATNALTVSRPSAGGQSIRIRSYRSPTSGQRPAQRQLAAHLAGQHELGLGQRQVGRDHVVVDRVAGLGAADEHVADRRLDVGLEIEVVRQVALRIEVDGQHRQPGPAQHVGERAHRRRLAGSTLLRQDGDRLGHASAQPTASSVSRYGDRGPGSCRRLAVLDTATESPSRPA